VTDDDRLVHPEGVEHGHDVGGQIGGRVRAVADRTLVAALIGGQYPVAGGDQLRHLVAPGDIQLREPVEQHDQGCVLGSFH